MHAAKAGEHIPGAHLAFRGKEVLINVSDNVVSMKRFDMLAAGVRTIVSQSKCVRSPDTLCEILEVFVLRNVTLLVSRLCAFVLLGLFDN